MHPNESQWPEGAVKFEEPYRHMSENDRQDRAESDAARKAEGQAFAKGEIKSANERIDSGEIPSRYKGK